MLRKGKSVKTEIYVLKDEHGRVRYVGKSSHCVKKRFSRHLADARDGAVQHKACWIRGMMQRGMLPTLEMIDKVDGDGCDAERKWIEFFRAAGVNLTNLTDGGEGIAGYKYSDKRKAEHSAMLKEYWSTREHHSKGRRAPDHVVAAMVAANTGRKLSLETREKLSEARKGIVFSDEHRRKLSESHSGARHGNYGKSLQAETRRKIAESVKKAHAEGRCAAPQRNKQGMFAAA
jgi:quinol monooxygenase YgiN